jgi:PPP family 3-phenylpropionic acid transporter
MPYYWRLSGFYFLYFALLGALVPYWSLYLKALGFSAAAIGMLMAVPQITKIGAPNLWGWLADRSGQRLRIIRLGNLAAALAFVPVFWVDRIWSMALLLAGFSFFWNAVLAQFEVVTLRTLGEQAHRYSQVRLWGSLGFIGAVLLVGWALDRLPIALLPWVMSALLWLLWAGTLLLPAGSPTPRARSGASGVAALLRRREVRAFIAASFLMQASHGPYYTFYSIHLRDLGFSTLMVGSLWALGVAAEVGLFLVMHRLLARFTLGSLLFTSLMLAALRWLMIGLCGANLAWLALAQVLHAASYASYHAASIAWVQRVFGDAHAGQGQALYSSLGYGAGWAVGAGLSGLYWSLWGAHSFFAAAAVAAGAALIAWRWLLHREP